MADFGFQTSQASGTSGIGGSGTTNYVSKFTAASTIGDSQIFDNGSNVGIGTNLPTAKLDVYINSITQLKYDSELTLNGLNGGIAGGSYLKFTAIPAQFYNLIRSSGNLGFTADGSFASMLLNSNGDLGVGLVAPTSKVHIKGIDSTSSNFALKVDNSASSSLFSVRNDGLFIFNGTIDGASSGNNNFEYKTITGSTRSAYYGATGLQTMFEFYTNSVKNTIISEVSGFYKISATNRFSIESITTGNVHLWMGASNGYIGIGNGYFVPTAQTHIKGIDATSSNYALKVENSASSSLFNVRNDGNVAISQGVYYNAKLDFGSYFINNLTPTATEQTSHIKLYDDGSLFYGLGVSLDSLNISTNDNDAAIKLWIAGEKIVIKGNGQASYFNTSGFIGVNELAPSAALHIKGFNSTGGANDFAFKADNSLGNPLLYVRNDGIVDIYGTITPRLQSIVSSATVTPTNLNDEVVITAQATGLTLVNPTGTAVQGQSMIIRIKDNGTARTIAYDTQYRAIGVTLPTTTVINKIVYLGLIYNSTDTKWDVIGVSQEA
jgi:hypothetical protein